LACAEEEEEEDEESTVALSPIDSRTVRTFLLESGRFFAATASSCRKLFVA